MGSEVYFIIGGMFLIFLFVEIYKRFEKKPTSVLIARGESDAELNKEEKKKKAKAKKESESFANRAHRVNWKLPKGYQQTVFIVFAVAGGIATVVVDTIMLLFAGIFLGLFYPHLQLRKREEAFDNEMPLRAEQAINAVEQQVQGDVPIFHALKNAVPYMQEPVKAEYKKAVDRIEKGSVPLERAVEGIPVRLGVPQLEYFHMILAVAQETEEKPSEIIRDASDMLRQQQKQTNRYNNEVRESKKEMKMMFGLVIVMVGSFILMLPEEQIPFAGTPLHRAMDISVIGLCGMVTWKYLKEIQAKNLFQ